MKRFVLSLALSAAVLPAGAGSSELRAGLMAHDVGVFGNRKESGADANVELLFDSPGWLAIIGAPRPHFGASLNLWGDTSQAYAGVSWQWAPAERWFIEFSLGGAVHSGKLSTTDLDRKELGSRALFRESLSLGYRLDQRNSVMVTFDHVSNASLADNNEGMDTLGLRWGYRF